MTNVGVVIVKPISENWFSEMRLYVPYRGLRVWTACSLDSACLGLCQQVLPLWFPKKSLFVRRGSAFFFVFCVFRVFVTRSVFCPGFRFARRRVLWVFSCFFFWSDTNDCDQQTSKEQTEKTAGRRTAFENRRLLRRHSVWKTLPTQVRRPHAKSGGKLLGRGENQQSPESTREKNKQRLSVEICATVSYF